MQEPSQTRPYSPNEILFPGRGRFEARAILVAERIEPRVIELGPRLAATTPVALRVGEHGCAIVFRYGVVVFFRVSSDEQKDFLERLQPFLRNPTSPRVTDELELDVDPGRRESLEQDGRFVLHAPTVDRLQIVADVLATSVILDHYEEEIAATFDKVEPIAVDLEKHGTSRKKAKALLRQIGSTLLTEHRMVGRVEIGENPEILWDRPELERLYVRLMEEYELRERHRALERKLDVITRTTETMLELIHNRRSLRVEWYIVILILVEIVLSLISAY